MNCNARKYEIRSFIIKYYFRKFCKKIDNEYMQRKKKYCGISLMNDELFQSYLQEQIKNGKPFMAARLGSVELRCIKEKLLIEHGMNRGYSEKTIHSMNNNAGFFPCNTESFERFGEMMLEACSQVDILGVWYNEFEDLLIKHYMNNPLLVRLRALEPYCTQSHWTSALKGKKVLVIHPFADTIRQQYEKREMLFADSTILPKFELLTLKAVVTHAGQNDERFKTWFEAFEYMLEEAMKYNFDVAVIGCGAYGFPLAAALKQNGKQAIHLGGATQLLFGIKGKRWDDNPRINRLYNDTWVRPSDSERPKNQDSVENGCYW